MPAMPKLGNRCGLVGRIEVLREDEAENRPRPIAISEYALKSK